MRKLFQIMAVTITVLSNAYAAKPPTPTFGGATFPNPANSSQVMSSETYKGTVSKLGAETTKNLDQTVQQQIKSSAGSPPPPAVSASTSNSPGTNTPTQPSQPATNANTESEDDATAFPPPAQPSSTNRRSANPAPTAQQSDQPSSSSQPYTGFSGGGQTNQNSKSGGSNQDGKSGGWSIGY